MPGLINITLVGDQALIQRLRAMPAGVAAAVTIAVSAAALKLQRHIVADKLSGQVLNVRTGDLRRSIQSTQATRDGDLISAKVYSDGSVKYAAIHEFGFSGPESVKTHVRDVVFGRQVSPFVVPQFIRQMNMPQRSFMRTGLADLRQEITDDIATAAKRGAREAVHP